MAAPLHSLGFAGDVIALHALPDGSGALAGCGNELRWLSLPSAALLWAGPLFPSDRLHGLQARAANGGGHLLVARGGRRVAAFALGGGGADGAAASCAPLASLPPFPAWVLDAQPLPEREAAAVGLADNSVSLWRLRDAACEWRCACLQSALLSSLALRLDGCEVRVAAGTVDGSVLLWRAASASASAPVSAALRGHCGAVRALAFSADGTRLASASDDRTLRLWSPAGEGLPECTLFGHSGRVWDVAFAGDVLCSCGEDAEAPVRLWCAHSGAPLGALRGHSGRGAWRVAPLPAPHAALLSGGADGAVKLWSLEEARRGGGREREARDAFDAFELPEPEACGGARCVALPSADALLVGCGDGTLRVAALGGGGCWGWQAAPLYASPAPLTALRAASQAAPSLPASLAARGEEGVLLVAGDGGGGAALLRLSVIDPGRSCISAQLLYRWAAHPGGKVASVFWLAGEGARLAATADALGGLCVWAAEPGAADGGAGAAPALLLRARAPQRVVCCAAAPLPGGGLLAALGDQRGGVSVLQAPLLPPPAARDAAEPPAALSRAHGGAAVTALFLSPDASDASAHLLTSAGADGMLVSHSLRCVDGAGPPEVAVAARRRLAAISVVEQLMAAEGGGLLASGCTFNSLILFDVEACCELARVDCGGWRRPKALAVGEGGRWLAAFARGGRLVVARRWPQEDPPATAATLLCGQHGRELRSARLLELQAGLLLLTASEDGTVRAAHFGPSDRAPAASWQVGQAPGRAALRALDALPLPGGGWLVAAAGAKASLCAWRLCGEGSARLLALREGRPGAEAAARHLALSLALASDALLLAAVARSDTLVQVYSLALEEGRPRWRLAADDGPMDPGPSSRPLPLSLAFLPASARWLLCGYADGSLAAWAAPPATAVPGRLRPALRLARAHQSGVTCLAPARTRDGWRLASGGDDGAVVLLSLREEDGGLACVGAARCAAAHASALRGLAWAPGPDGPLLSAGLDQRLRVWAADEGPAAQADADAAWLAAAAASPPPGAAGGAEVLDLSAAYWARAGARAGLRLLAASVTSVCDTEALAACAAGEGGVAAAVAGHGAQLWRLSPTDVMLCRP